MPGAPPHPASPPVGGDELNPHHDCIAFVDLKGVSLTYRMGKEKTLALADATFSIDKGEFIAVVGPVGLRQVDPDEAGDRPAATHRGEVRVGGEKVTGPIKGVGMAFQNPTLMPWRTTLDNVLLPLEIVEPHKRGSAASAPTIWSAHDAPQDGGSGWLRATATRGNFGWDAAARLAVSGADPRA